MRTSAVIVGLVSLLAAFAMVSWAIQPTPSNTAGKSTFDPNEYQNRLKSRRDAEADAEAAAQAEAHRKAEAEANDPTSPKAHQHKTNPFQLVTEGPMPKAVVDELRHDFDRLAVGATGSHTFQIRNDGEAPLKLAKGQSTCKCTGFGVGVEGITEVAPGETAAINLEWHPEQEASEFDQIAFVWTNDATNPKLELHVKGAIVPLISTVPKGNWTFGTISEGSPSVVHGTIAAYLADAFEIEGIESSSEYVKVDYEPLADDDLKRTKALSGYKLTCTVDAGIPVGTFYERIKVRTSLDEAPQVQFTLSGNRVGPFQVIGPGWQQSENLLRMGRCKAAEGKTTQISFFVAVPDGLDFAFGEPQVSPPIVNVTVKQDESFSGANGRERHVVAIHAPPGITPGRWGDDSAIKVVLPCNHPYTDSAEFNLALQAD